jgi:hypothetical protein
MGRRRNPVPGRRAGARKVSNSALKQLLFSQTTTTTSASFLFPLLNDFLFLKPPTPPRQAMAQGVNVAQIVAAKNASLNALLARKNGSVAFMRK